MRTYMHISLVGCLFVGVLSVCCFVCVGVHVCWVVGVGGGLIVCILISLFLAPTSLSVALMYVPLNVVMYLSCRLREFAAFQGKQSSSWLSR